MTAPLDDGECARITRGHCPECGYRGFVLGPRGGNSINIECGSKRCRARFNVASLWGNHRVVMGHRIPRLDEGGSNWD